MIDEKHEPEFDKIVEEVTNTTNSNQTLQKRKEKLINKIVASIRSTTTIEEIESIEAITAAINPTLAAVRNNKPTFTPKDLKKGNIVPQRRLFSTKKTNKKNNRQNHHSRK